MLWRDSEHLFCILYFDRVLVESHKLYFVKNLFLLLLVSTSIHAFAQSKHVFIDAVHYNDYIVERQAKIGERIGEFMAVLSDSSTNFDDAERVRLNSIDSIKLYISEIENISWKGDNSLSKVSVKLFTFYQNTFENEYAAISKIVYRAEYTKADGIELDNIIASITAKEKVIDNEFGAAQTKFASDNNFDLSE